MSYAFESGCKALTLNGACPLEAPRIEESAPVTLGGVPGFRARFAYKTQSGLQYRCLYYGAVSGGSVYSLCCQAPARHYFGKDLDTFEKAVKTFRLLKS